MKTLLRKVARWLITYKPYTHESITRHYLGSLSVMGCCVAFVRSDNTMQWDW